MTYANAIIPKCYIILLPLKADMSFLCRGDQLIEIINDGIALSFRDPDNFRDKAGVEEDGFPASDSMCADQGMLCDNWVASHCPSESDGSICLHLRGMECLEIFKVRLHAG